MIFASHLADKERSESESSDCLKESEDLISRVFHLCERKESTELIKQLTSYRDSIGFELLVFDSLGAFFTLTKMENPRDEIFRLFEAVRRLGLTSFFICEMTGEDNKQFGEYGVEDYLADGVIHLVMERSGDDVARKMGVVKMRHTNHRLGYKP
ncbi:MAG: hypothetical protein OSA21_01800, partial [Candidatus Poseidoniaceae archaeon]|nr:hypothetical protein [Candidatus Poseidoniaceae archaeon]